MSTLSKILLLSILLLISCENNFDSDIQLENEFVSEVFTLYNLPENRMPYSELEPLYILKYGDSGPDSIVVFHYGDSVYYHPTRLCGYPVQYMKAYDITKDEKYLKMAEKYIAKLFEISITQNDATFFPFYFNYSPHGSSDLINAPWSSALTQGYALTALVRLYKRTNKKKYLDKCHQIVNSFLPEHRLAFEKDKKKIWTGFVDKDNYLWLEEYPLEEPSHILNGFIFALYGLYEYYLESNDKLAKDILFAGLTTIKNHAYLWRNKGHSSYYCLKHHRIDPHYHEIHKGQFMQLYLITRDDFFLNFYLDLDEDL